MRSCPPKFHHISGKNIYQKCHLRFKSDEADIQKVLCLAGWLHCGPDVHFQLSRPRQMTNQDSSDKSSYGTPGHGIWVFITKKLWENKPYSQKLVLITKIFYCIKAHSISVHPKNNHIAEKTIYPETHISGTQCTSSLAWLWLRPAQENYSPAQFELHIYSSAAVL